MYSNLCDTILSQREKSGEQGRKKQWQTITCYKNANEYREGRVTVSTESNPFCKKHSQSTGILRSSLRRTLHEDLHLHPYKMQVTQQLCVVTLKMVRAIIYFRILRNTPQNMEHLLYIFRISCKFRLLLMLRKNKQRNPLTFRVMPTLGQNAKKGTQNVKKVMQNTPLYTFHFLRPSLRILRYVYSRPKAGYMLFAFCECFR